MAEFGIGVTIVLTLAGLLIAILWILMPFAVFGIKDLARDLIRENRKTNQLLEQLIAQSTPPK
jgi:predicted PurR-regulated permease PerM